MMVNGRGGLWYKGIKNIEKGDDIMPKSKCPYCGADTCGKIYCKSGDTFFLMEGYMDDSGKIFSNSGIAVDVYACSTCKKIYLQDNSVTPHL
jgi:DNA-directed RNA polymerase subunit RPC12/RpoP